MANTRSFREEGLDGYVNGAALNLDRIRVTFGDLQTHIIPYLKAHPEVTHVDLRMHEIGLSGAHLLAEVPTIIWLDLAYNRLGDPGAKVLAASSTLTSLNVCHNNIGDHGALAFLSNTALKSLDLGENQISPSVLKQLSSSDRTWEYLRLDGHLKEKSGSTLFSNRNKNAENRQVNESQAELKKPKI